MHRRLITYGFAQRHSAQALVEFALILPLMLILVLGSLDIGRALVFGVAIQDGTREAARLGASAAVDNLVTDTMVRQRLIDASSPALDACDATFGWGAQPLPCGWTFTIEFVPTHTTIAQAQADPLFPGSQLTITASGQVSLWSGFSTPWGWALFPIGAQGRTSMMVMG